MRTVLGAIALFAVYGLVSTPCRADILVAGFDADLVLQYNSSGGFVDTFASHASMDGPTAMVYNTAGSLLVLNEFSHNVLEFNGTTGEFIGEFISPAGLGSVGATDPGDMEIGPDGNLYITSHFSTGGNVWKFNGTTGDYLGVFASTGSANHTHGLTFGPGGDLYQNNLDTRTIMRFSGVDGSSESPFTSHPDMFPGGDLIFGPSGSLYVTLDGGGGTMHFNSSGTFLGYIIDPGAATWGLLVDGGILYVGGKSTGFVKKFDAATGAFIADFITGAPAVFDILILPTAVPEVGAAAMLTLAATCVGAVITFKKWRRPLSK